MLFRNAFVFGWDALISADELEDVLSSRAFSGIGELDVEHLGWVNPKEDPAGPLVHVVDSIYLVAMQKESKIIPASTLKRKTAAAALEAEKQKGRSLTRKERSAIKHEVLDSLLPGAPTRTSITMGAICLPRKQLVVLTSSRKSVDQFHGLFVDSFMKRNIKPSFRKIRTVQPPNFKMVEWLSNNECEGPFALGEHCELRYQKSKVRYTVLELDRPEIREHLQEGRIPVKLGLRHDSTMSFIIGCDDLDEDIGFSKIDYGDNDGKTESDATADEVFDSDLFFAVTEFLDIANALFQGFGGIAPDVEALAMGCVDE